MMLLSAFLTTSLFVGGAFASTVADVVGDLASITTSSSNLDRAVVAFPSVGGSLTNALSIHTGTTALGSLIDKGTTDLNGLASKPVGESDGKTILNVFEALQPLLIQFLSDVAVKKSAFLSLPIGGVPALIKLDLVNLKASTDKFEDVLIGSLPADFLVPAINTTFALDAALASAFATYS